MRLAMLLFSALCIGIGILPGPLYAMLPFAVDYVPYTASHVVFQLQLLLFSGLAFFLMLGWLKRTLTITLDVDWLYRRLGFNLARALDNLAGRVWQWLVASITLGAKRVNARLHQHHGPEGVLGRSWPTGTMAFWTTVMLAIYLILTNL
jgi:multicomponent Na+:H+ antiporter subunit D